MAAAAGGLAAACGGSGQTAGEDAPARVTPVPSGAPAPKPGDELHAGASPTATPAPDEGGDEEGIAFPVDVRVSRRGIRSQPASVPAFLPLRLTVANGLDRRIRLRVTRRGGGAAVARVVVSAGGRTRFDVDGLQPGRVTLRSPDLRPGTAAVVRVEPGGG